MRTEFPAGITIRWNFGGFESGGKGSCFIYFDYFLTADTGWLKSWFKKIVSIADYSDQVAALTELDEYLVFNIDRLTTETKETFSGKEENRDTLDQPRVDRSGVGADSAQGTTERDPTPGQGEKVLL